MKKIVFITIALILVVVVAIAIFIATFNINNYKAALLSELEATTGSKAEIGRLSLQWKGKVILGIEKFKLYTEEDGQKINKLSFDSASAALDLGPLLLHQARISSISLVRPEIQIVRRKDATVEVRGYNEKPSKPSGIANSKGAAKDVFNFTVESIDIKDGTIRFQDMMNQPGADVILRKLDAEVKNISTSGPIEFNVKMAFTSSRQNISFSGLAGGFASSSPFVKDLKVEADLGTLDHAELLKAVPALQKAGFGPGLKGIFKANVKDLALSGNKISKIYADMSFTDGRIEVAGLKAPLEKVNLSASAEGDNVLVKSFSVQLANGFFKGMGKIDNIFISPRTELQATATVEGVKSFLASVFVLNQNMDGNASLTFSGTMTGTAWPEISKTLAGGGEFTLDRGVAVNTNILNQTLGSMTLFPNMPETVRGYVPVPIQQAFKDNNTTIKPLKQAYTIDSGYILLPNLNLETDTFDMRGNAKSSFTGDISGSGIMRFTQSVSTAMIQAVPEMKYITDDQGMVEFPMSFKAGEEDFRIIPDLKYVGQKVAVQKAGEVVADYIQKATKDSGISAAQGAAIQSGKTPKLKDIMKSLMEQ